MSHLSGQIWNRLPRQTRGFVQSETPASPLQASRLRGTAGRRAGSLTPGAGVPPRASAPPGAAPTSSKYHLPAEPAGARRYLHLPAFDNRLQLFLCVCVCVTAKQIVGGQTLARWIWRELSRSSSERVARHGEGGEELPGTLLQGSPALQAALRGGAEGLRRSGKPGGSPGRAGPGGGSGDSGDRGPPAPG